MGQFKRGPGLLLAVMLGISVVVSACSSGSIGTVNTDVGKYTITGVEAGQLDVTACHGTECTINRDGVYFAKREIVVTLKPEAAGTGVAAVSASAFAKACTEGGLFVSDGVNGFGCESFNVGEDGGVAVVFSEDMVCRNCPDDGFDGDLVLNVPGNEPLPLK